VRCFVVAGFLLTSALRGPSAIAELLVVIILHISSKAETFVKIGSVVVEIFSEIGHFLQYRFKSTNFLHLNLWHYWSKVHHICI